MKILFDHKIFYQQKYGGISNYFFNLCREFIPLKVNFKIFCFFFRAQYLKKIPKRNFDGIDVSFMPGKLNPILDWINKLLIENKSIDTKNTLVHETYYSNYYIKNIRKTLVLGSGPSLKLDIKKVLKRYFVLVVSFLKKERF